MLVNERLPEPSIKEQKDPLSLLPDDSRRVMTIKKFCQEQN